MEAIFLLRLAVVSLALAVEPAEPTTGAQSEAPPNEILLEQSNGDSRRNDIEAILDSKIDLKVDKTPLPDVLAVIHAKTQLNFIFDNKAFQEAALDVRGLLVTIDVTGVPVRAILKIILRDHDLAWLRREQAVIFITTSARAETMSELRVYAVGDLVMRPDGGWPHATYGPKILVADGGPIVGPITEVDALIETITSTVAPTTWGEVGGTGAIKFFPNALALIVSQTQEVHYEIEDLLKELRETRRLQIATSPRQDPSELLLASYAMPRYVPSWRVNWPVSPSQYAYPQHYEIDLKASLADAAATAKEFAAVIPQVIEPASWKTAGGKGEIFVVNDRLVVRQTAAVQSQIARLLSDNSPAIPASASNIVVGPGNTGS